MDDDYPNIFREIEIQLKTYCSDCIHYNRISHTCSLKKKVLFERGCEKCGIPHPENYECRDFERNEWLI